MMMIRITCGDPGTKSTAIDVPVTGNRVGVLVGDHVPKDVKLVQQLR